MIKKVAHYIWLGKDKLPKSYYLSIESLKKYQSNFEIKIWSEDQLADFDLPVYFYKLMQERKYALASDIYRFHILYRYGGVYFDVDQILIASIDDLLSYQMFISKYHEVNDYYGFGLIGIESKHLFSKKMIDFYSSYYTNNYVIVNKIGSEIINDMLPLNKIKILDQEYFYPLTKNNYTENTRSYHLANTSWIPWYRKVMYKIPFYTKIKNFIKAILPKTLKRKIFKIDYL